jgi:Arc/MetJ family transcription regulator
MASGIALDASIMHRMMPILMHESWRAIGMRTTINVDEQLLAEAQRITGVRERTALIHAGLRALIERESARRLAKLGGSEPGLTAVRRRRPKSA